MARLTAYDKFIQVALKYGFSLFGLPKTGQTIVYTAGDDGTYQKGYPKTGARFTDNGDGTITDNATGLMWAKDGTGAGCNNGTTLTWVNAIAFCEALNFAGHTDWRLPNLKELASIVDYSVSNPSIDPLFINAFAGLYWSSTNLAGFVGYAYWCNFTYGQTLYDDKVGERYVRAVRGGA
jgi:hypothetical protein